MITQQRLKEVLSYNSSTGEFVWLFDCVANKVKGKVAGSIKTGGYRQIRIEGQRYAAHRLAWLYVHGKFPPDEIDHINGMTDDNRIDNIRAVSHTENAKNRRMYKNNKSGIMGVAWAGKAKKWWSQIRLSGKTKSLGYHKDFFEACCARKSAEKKYTFHTNHGRLCLGYKL